MGVLHAVLCYMGVNHGPQMLIAHDHPAVIDLYVPTTRSELGKRSFHVAALRIWNSLPLHLRSFTISRQQFRTRLKTHFFKCAYT